MKTTKEKTAIISILLKLSYTLLKFIAYAFTGSIAILAEAWHSFTDILTSLLVYLSVKEKRKEEAISASQVASSEKKAPEINVFVKNVPRIFSEHNVSLFIGLFLLLLSIGIFKKVATYPKVEIQNPLIVGILFILFSFFSYAISELETRVGKKEKSLALVADGKHSKADMGASLLAGFSLILYKMGFNIDRSVGIFIAFFIFCLAVEVTINAVISIRKKEEIPFRYNVFEIIGYVFRKEPWINFIRFIDKKFMLGLEKSNFMKKLFRHSLLIFVLILLILYCSTSFYVINTSQQGIIERFGKCINLGSPIRPGLHVKLPWPIDKVVKVNSKIIQKFNIGNVVDENTFALLWTKPHGTEIPFLSGDNNFFYPYFVAHYEIKDIFQFHYNHKTPEKLLDNITYKVISDIFAKKSFYEIVTTYRKQLESDVIHSIQEELDSFESGLGVIALNIKDIHPPIFIADSFEDVIAAYQDKKRMVNEAIAHKNSSLPKARGESAQKVGEAESFVFERINQAEGNSSRFIAQLDAYNMNKYVASKRLYLKFIKEGLRNKRKIVVDPSSGIPEVWLDFDKAIKFVD